VSDAADREETSQSSQVHFRQRYQIVIPNHAEGIPSTILPTARKRYSDIKMYEMTNFYRVLTISEFRID
jgi:hypothetical protein